MPTVKLACLLLANDHDAIAAKIPGSNPKSCLIVRYNVGGVAVGHLNERSAIAAVDLFRLGALLELEIKMLHHTWEGLPEQAREADGTVAFPSPGQLKLQRYSVRHSQTGESGWPSKRKPVPSAISPNIRVHRY